MTSRPNLLALVALLVVSVGALATIGRGAGGVVHAQSAYPPLRGFVANGTDMAVSEARINNEFQDRIADAYDLDGIVLLVPDCRPDPEVYLDGALVHYDLAPAAGEMVDDAIAIMVCEDPRFVGAFWSANNPYEDALDSDDIADAMIPALQDGNFTGAVTEGIDEVVSAIEAANAPVREESVPARDPVAAAVGDGGQDRGQSGGQDGSQDRAQSGGRSGGRNLAGWLLAGIAGLGGLWLLWTRGSDGEADEASDTTDEFQPVKDLDEALEELRATLREDNPNLARLILAYEPLGDEAVLALERRHGAMRERLDVLEEEAAGLVRGPQADPQTGDPEVRRRYEEALEEANALLAYARGLKREAVHAEELEEKAAVLAVQARKAIEQARTAYATRRPPGDLPAPDDALAFARHLADAADDALSEGQRLRAGERAEDAIAAAERTAGFVGELEEVEALIERAAEAFDRVDDHAESTWADIRGNGTEAEESVDAATELFSKVVESPPEAYGEDPAAGYQASLQRAYDELDRARLLAQAVIDRLTHIREAKSEAGEMSERIARELAEAQAFLADPSVDRDVGPAPEEALETAESNLLAARASMGEPQPDWLAIRRQLIAADRAIDDAMGAARAERERMNALRKQLEAARKDAEAALGRAARYVDAHAGDVGESARASLVTARDMERRTKQAQARLQSLEEDELAAGLRELADDWERCRQTADEAYRSAAADVERHEQERRRRDHVPRPVWMGPTIPIPRSRRSWPMSPLGGGWNTFGGGGGRVSRSPGPMIRPSRSSWGGGSGGGSGGGRPSSGRRGGGKGW